MQINVPIEEIRKRSLFLACPMYGGACSGIFTKSLTDLTGVCLQYGIKLMHYFLFNESLITRARNYCVDEFLRSDCTHLMFIDSDIGFNAQDVIALLALSGPDTDYDVIAGPYPKKSKDFNSLILTEDGYQKIGLMVKNKYSGKVMTLSDDGKFEWNKVVEHHSFPANPNKMWVKVKAGNNTKLITCTADHELYVTDNVFEPNFYKLAADLSQNKYIIRKPENKNTNSVNPLFTKEKLNFLYGTLLGDGSINSKGYLKFGHSDKQYEYLNLKQKLFGGIISEEKVTGKYTKADGTEKIYYGKFLHSNRNIQISELRNLVYPNGIKRVNYLMDNLDDMGLAVWYMDDGSLTKNGNEYTVRLCTDSFSYEDHQYIQKILQEKWGIETKIIKQINKFRISILASSQSKFFNIISKYIISELDYKIPTKYVTLEENKHQYNFDDLEYAAEKIVNVKRLINTRKRHYDIGVENNHNFVSNGYVVSNCISWEKIKMAVDKGFADDNANELEKFVGDYVFNPVGVGSISLGEPAEVLEAGTGFMMIRRETFEKYEAAYPQYKYLPDHVRTQHFDGTREIMCYFQAEIDEASRRYLSEDYLFCQNVRKMGGHVWLCPWMQLQHMGSYNFAGSLVDLARIGASATVDVSQLKKDKK